MKKFNYQLSVYYNLLLLAILFNLVFQQKPIIGMYGLVEPISDYSNYNKEAIDGGFVRWLEASGAEIVVIHIWYSHEQIILIFCNYISIKSN